MIEWSPVKHSQHYLFIYHFSKVSKISSVSIFGNTYDINIYIYIFRERDIYIAIYIHACILINVFQYSVM